MLFVFVLQNAMTLSSLSSSDPEMQLNLQHVLGKPNIIRPKSGDLVLICAQRVSDLWSLQNENVVHISLFLSHML